MLTKQLCGIKEKHQHKDKSYKFATIRRFFFNYLFNINKRFPFFAGALLSFKQEVAKLGVFIKNESSYSGGDL